MVETPPSPYEQPLDLPGGEQPGHTPRTPKSKRSHKRLILAILGVGLLIGLGYAGTQLLDNKSEPTHQTAQTEEPTATPPPAETPVSSGDKTFTAETLAVEFQHPAEWSVTEKDGAITIKSPVFNYQKTGGATTNGFFKVYIRKMARDVDGKYIGRAVAMKATEPLTYTSPAVSQRKTTNLSFFGYDETSNFAFFMITGNFNLKKGETLGPNYGKEADTYIIVGGYGSAEDKDDLSFRMLSTSNFENPAAYKQAIEILKSLKVS